MKKMLSVVLVGAAILSLSACGQKEAIVETTATQQTESESTFIEESTEKEDAVVPSTDSASKEETTIMESLSSDLSFDEMKSLFVIEGDRSMEVIVEGAFTYQISEKSYEDVVTQIKDGLKKIDAKAIAENDDAQVYSFVGSYGKDEDIAITITGGDVNMVSIAYGTMMADLDDMTEEAN